MTQISAKNQALEAICSLNTVPLAFAILFVLHFSPIRDMFCIVTEELSNTVNLKRWMTLQARNDLQINCFYKHHTNVYKQPVWGVCIIASIPRCFFVQRKMIVWFYDLILPFQQSSSLVQFSLTIFLYDASNHWFKNELFDLNVKDLPWLANFNFRMIFFQIFC